MNQDFYKFITDKAPPIPDTGPGRRATRALLHERMRRDVRRERTRDLRGMSLAASLVFLIVLGGPVTDLGSDGFDVTMEEINLGDYANNIFVDNEFRGTSLAFLEGTSQEIIDEANQMLAAGESIPHKLFGFQVQGKTNWNMEYLYIINGERIIMASKPEDLVGHTNLLTLEIFSWLEKHSEEFLSGRDLGLIPRQEYGLVQSNGRTYQVYSWTKEYPEFGPVIYFEGLADN